VGQLRNIKPACLSFPNDAIYWQLPEADGFFHVPEILLLDLTAGDIAVFGSSSTVAKK
jgi:hypothetical protein